MEKLPALLRQLARRRISGPAELIRFHEALLFFRAYAPSAAVLRLAEEILASFSGRVAKLAETGMLEEPDMSGIAGTGLCGVFTRDLVRLLLARHGGAMRLAWDAYDQPARLAHALNGLLPYYEDEALVEARPPYREWVEAAGGLGWLVENSECFDAAEIPIEWQLEDSPATRTHMRLEGRRNFHHRRGLIARSEVSLPAVVSEPALAVRKLSHREGRRVIDLAQDTSAVRYRELYGFTWGDARHVHEYDAGRGVVFYWWGLPPKRRLPLRAYHAVTIWKNGVPIGYFEGLSLLDRVEAGFNLYYTFREGETAWLYSRLLKLFHQAAGATCFWLDPYQIGHDNEEAVDAGAFWFYRKLGYESVDADLRRLTEREEKKIATRPGYRTPKTVLRRLSRRPMIFGFPGSHPERWHNFDLHRLTMTLALGKAPALAKRLWVLEEAKRAPEETVYLDAMRRDKRLWEGILEAGE